MDKMQMCRICLVKDVGMYVVVNKNLHELYEKLTYVPFVTEDSRPMLACFFCCTKLKQCWQFQRKCLKAEELFTQMMNVDYERDPLINQGQLSYQNGFVKTPIENMNIFGICQIESISIKEELPEICEKVNDIGPKKEHQNEERKIDYVHKSYSDVKDLPVHHVRSNSEHEAPIMNVKIEVEEGGSLGAPVARKPKLDTRRTKIEREISAERKKNENKRKTLFVSTNIKKTPERISNSVTLLKVKDATTETKPNSTTTLSTSCHNKNNEDDICKVAKEGIDSYSKNSHPTADDKEKSFQCDICQRYFKKRYYLTRHSRIHSGQQPFQCDICQRNFNDRSHLMNHIRTHTGERPFKCDICQRSYNQKSHLTSHARMHTGEEPFKCDICKRCFYQKCHLRRHIRTHTGEKPFSCNICQRTFCNNSQLKIHMLTHTGERPHKCDLCKRGFNQRVHLRNHACVATVEKPHKCHICERRFNIKSALANHVNTHARTGEDSYSFILGT